jgi:hypothetical protein
MKINLKAAATPKNCEDCNIWGQVWWFEEMFREQQQKLLKVLMMVYYTWDYEISGFCPPSIILKEHVFETRCVSEMLFFFQILHNRQGIESW